MAMRADELITSSEKSQLRDLEFKSSALAGADQKITLMTNGDIARATFEMIEMAKFEIISMEFLLRDDLFGMMKLALLRQKARSGVKVLIHVDSFHLLIHPALVAHLAKEGIFFSIYNDLRLRKATKFSFRNHCKFLIIDRRLFKTGDTNSGNEYVHWPSRHKMKSLDVVIDGPLTEQARAYALEVLASPLTSTPRVRVASESEVQTQRRRFQKLRTAMRTFLRLIHVQTDGPDQITKPDCILVTKNELQHAIQELDHAEQAYLAYRANNQNHPLDWKSRTIATQAVRFFCDPVSMKGRHTGVGEAVASFCSSAKHELIILSPYLILTDQMKASIKQALRNGAVVRFYTNSKSSTDNHTTQWAYEYRFAEIASLGNVEIFEFTGPETLHAKFLLRDDSDCMLMTYNIDWRSETKNLETALHFQDQALYTRLHDWLHEHQKYFVLVANHTRLLKSAYRDQSASDRIRRWVIQAIEKHL